MPLKFLSLALTAVCSAMITPLLAAELPDGWKSYPSPPGAFAIAFPSKPMEQKEVIQGLDGSGDVDQIQYLVGQADGAYLASFQPAPKLASSDAQTVSDALDHARDRLAAVYAGKVQSTQEVKLGTATGKEVVVDCPNIMGVIRSRMFLANGRFYQVMLIGKKEFIATPEADAFLQSFKLTK